ncbi:MAG: hypothetical protein J7623_21890 [Chitinophaga sp.]|uniref:hypothetical protein n=1 Tax=Chitinophaga sp. TaxID=1869181 RepID=UPI001B26290B|nr:hypothetical protein [Chitinophaga sp.]MBO9731306.1 hypothetical protein [Chitinophaga sp.]
MKKCIFLLALAACLMLTIFQSCKKRETDTHGPGKPTPPYELVRAIHWDNGAEESMIYNTDSSLKQIDARFRTTMSNTIFEWEDGKIKKVYQNYSLYKDTYYYENGRISYYTIGSDLVPSSTYKMVFSYKSNGLPDKQQYYTINEAGTKLNTETTYEYNAAGELFQAVTTTGNSIFTHTVDQYTDSVNFNPLFFIQVGLFENYAIFNLPVMSTMKKYPAKIVRTVKTGNAAPQIDKISENTCEISNKRINKITLKTSILGTTPSSNTVTGVFEYH